MESQPSNSVKSFLKNITEFSIVISFFIYFLGFLTVNSYLTSLGFFNVELVNARYISAGIHAMLLFTITVGLSYYLHTRIFKSWKNQPGIPEKKITLFEFNIGTIQALLAIWGVSYAISAVYQQVAIKVTQDLTAFNAPNFFGITQNIKSWFPNASPYLHQYFYTLIVVGIPLAIIIGLFSPIADLIIRKKHNSKELQTPKAVSAKTISHNGSDWIESGIVKHFSRAWLVFDIVLLVALYSYALGKLSFYSISSEKLGGAKLDSITILVWLTSSVISILMYANLLYKKSSLASFHNFLFALSEEPYTVSYLVGATLAVILMFGRVVYPRIPYTIGGGSTKEVKIFLDKNHKETATFLSSDNTIYLIDRTPTSYLLVVKDKKGIWTSLEVQRNIVDSITSVKTEN